MRLLTPDTQNPLSGLGQWENAVRDRYVANRKKEDFRQHNEDAPSVVREFYRLNHTNQTVDFVRAKKREYAPLAKRRMGVWEAMEYLNTLVDDSDPDTDLSQIQHLIQTAEAARRDGRPRWFILSGLVHDLGKILCLYGEPQWAVVGDTFPVGCAWSDKIVYPQYFAANPDSKVPEYQTPNGVYREGCGLANVDLSWGHDEYIYQVSKPYLPESGLYMLRYHSFYPCHQDGAYEHLMDARDREMFYWVREFNQYDLYSRGEAKPDVEALRPYYENLIAEFFPPLLNW